MVDLKKYQNTPTILISRTQEEYNTILPYFNGRFTETDFLNFNCIHMDNIRGKESHSSLRFIENYKYSYQNYKFIEVSDLINKIHELW